MNGTRSRSVLGQRKYEDFDPRFEWVREQGTQTLLIDLPGFKKEHLRVQLDTCGNLKVSGERQVTGGGWSRFRKEFLVPENSSTGEIRAKFEDGLLYVIIPKLLTQDVPKTDPPVKQQEAPSSQNAAAANQNVEEGKEGVSAATGQTTPPAAAVVDQKPRTDAKVAETGDARKDDESKVKENERTKVSSTETDTVPTKNLRNGPGRMGLSVGNQRQLAVNAAVAMLVLLGLVIYATYRFGISREQSQSTEASEL